MDNRTLHYQHARTALPVRAEGTLLVFGERGAAEHSGVLWANNAHPIKRSATSPGLVRQNGRLIQFKYDSRAVDVDFSVRD